MTTFARQWLITRLTLLIVSGMTGVMVLALAFAPTWLLVIAGWFWLALIVGLSVGAWFRLLEDREEQARDREDFEVASLDAIWELS